MADTETKAPPSPPRRRWLKILGVVTVAFVGLVVVPAYFVVTSSGFIKGMVLPRVSRALHEEISVSDVSVHPFSEIELHDLKIQAKGQPPVVQARGAHVRYHLLDILSGRIRVTEATLTSPSVLIIENPDGTSNLDPLFPPETTQPSAKKQSASAPGRSEPAQIDLQKITLDHGTLVRIKNYGGGAQDTLELTNANLTLDQFRNGQPGRLNLSAEIRLSNRPAAPASGGLMEATLTGSFDYSLMADLKPARLKGEARLGVTQATGRFNDLSAVNVVLSSEVTPTNIPGLALRVSRGGAALGELNVRGPLAMEKLEGRLTVELRGIDRRVLNLAGAAWGIDFGTTTINSTNEIALAKSGSLVSARGRFAAERVQLAQAGKTTPALNLNADYDVTLDRTAQTAALRQLTLAGTQNGNPLLNAQLSRPMNLAWGNGPQQTTDSSLDLTVDNLDLKAWKPFLGDTIPTGPVDLKLKLSSQGAGKQLNFDLNSQSRDLTVSLGENRSLHVAATLLARGQVTDFKRFVLTQCQLEVTRGNQPAAILSGSGNCDLGAATADFQTALQLSLPGFFQTLEQPGLSASAGTAEVKARFIQKAGTRAVSGNLDLKQWTGQFDDRRFNAFGIAMDFDAILSSDKIQVNKAAGSLSQAGNPGGRFNLSGSYAPATCSLQLTAALSGVNQNGLKPFLDPLLAGEGLATVVVNGDASVNYVPNRASAFKADLQVTNLVVSAGREFPATPLEARLQLDATIQKQTAEVRQFQLALTPTARAQNRVQLEGKVDFTNTNALEGKVKLTADSLDITPYYDLFVGKKKNAAKTSTADQSAHETGPSPNLEPPARKFPFHNFTAEIDIQRLFLHDIDIRNWQTTAKLDGGHCLLQPCQLTLNDSPVNVLLDADFGVPGWKYRASLGAARVPVQPIADCFLPEAKGQYNGLVTAEAQISGAGVTGTSLKKYLDGTLSFSLTNASIQVVQSRTRFFFLPININLIAALLNIPEITRSPVTGADVKIKLGNGRIDIQKGEVRSSAFLGNVRGAIPIANVLSDSPLNIPVEVSLTNSLARKLTFSGAEHPSADYIQLPVFLTVTGTLGKPESKENKIVLAELTVGAVTGLGKSGVENVLKSGGSIINTILNGNPHGGGTNTQTNQPATHPSGIGGLLDRIIPK